MVAEPLMFFTLPLAGSTPPPDSKNAAAVLIAAEHLLSSMLKPVWPATCPAEAKEAVEMVGKVTVVAPLTPERIFGLLHGVGEPDA